MLQVLNPKKKRECLVNDFQAMEQMSFMVVKILENRLRVLRGSSTEITLLVIKVSERSYVDL